MRSKPILLIATDALEAQAWFAEQARASGYEAACCLTEEEVWQQARKNPLLALIDAEAVSIGGQALCRRLKALYPFLPQLVCLAPAANELDDWLAAGADDFFFKPLHWPLIAMRIKRFLELSRLKEGMLAREAHLQAGTDAYWNMRRLGGAPQTTLTLTRSLFAIPNDQTALDTFLARLHPDDLPAAAAEAQAFFDGLRGERLSQEFRVRVQTGEWRWFISKGRILQRDAQTGEPLVAAGVIVDVHQQKAMESQLAEAQLLGRTGSWSVPLESDLFTVSRGLCHLVGLEPDTATVESARLLARVHPEDREVLARLREVCQACRAAVPFECRTADKPAKILQGEARVVTDADNKPISLVGTVVDITERRRLERLLRDDLQRMHYFVAAVSDLSFILDETGQYVQVFGQRPDLLVDEPPNLLGRNIRDTLPAGVAKMLLKATQTALAANDQQEVEYELFVGDGYKRFSGKLVPMPHWQDGKRVVALLVVDVTSKHRTEEALRLSYERRRRNDFFNDLVAGRAHSTTDIDSAYVNCFVQGRFYSLALVEIESWRGEPLASWLKTRRMQLQYMIDELVDRLTKPEKQIAWDVGEGKIGLVVLAGSEEDLSEHGLDAWLKGVEGQFAGIRLRVGIASCGMQGTLAERYQEALQALEVGRKIWPDRYCYRYSELGVFQVLMQVENKLLLARYTQQTLGALLDYDRQKGAELVETLDAILTYPNLREAAEKLFIHYKTLLFRRKRIEELLALSLDEADNRVALAVAIRLWRLATARHGEA